MHDRKPHGLEYKSAPALAPATPAPAARRHATRITAALGPTGVPYQGDIVERGALGRAITARLPRVAVGHSWARPAGIVLGGVEVGPGDPRLPATTSDGQPWPRGGGGLILTVDVGPSTTRDGALATKAAQAAGHGAAWTFGYKVTDGRTAGGIRRVTALDIYSVAPPTISSAETKSAVVDEGLEVKGARGAGPRAGRKIFPFICDTCGGPGLREHRPGEPVGRTTRVCRACLDAHGLDSSEARQQGRGVLTARELDQAAELARITSEDAYAQALRDEVRLDAEPDGALRRARPGRRDWPA